MSAVVFLGPSLSRAEAEAALGATWLAPVAQGDVLRAVRRLRPRVIGIVDGVFTRVPSVWHKEILWALGEGVHVLGAASMGALRAAELAPFGMAGVGVVFEAYRDGVLGPTGDAPFEDDDEVAVLHGPAETGFAPLTEAMVDIRLTLAAAERAGVIEPSLRAKLTEVAKDVFYGERTWERVLAGIAVQPHRRLLAWLPEGRVRQKRADALAMLRQIAHLLEEDAPPVRPAFRLAHTAMWAAALTAEASEPATDETEAVLEELRLDSERYDRIARAALLRAVAADRTGPPDAATLRVSLRELRERLAAHDGRHARQVLADRGLGERDLDAIAADEASVAQLLARDGQRLDGRLLDGLRLSGEYPALRARAAAKAARLAQSPGPEPAEQESAADLASLLWYFEEKLGLDLPADLDGFARLRGFADADALRLAVAREYRFVGLQADREG